MVALSALLFIHSCGEKRWIHAFSKSISTNCKQPCSEFELGLPSPFTTMLTITPHTCKLFFFFFFFWNIMAVLSTEADKWIHLVDN